jgi:hypothetical protein
MWAGVAVTVLLVERTPELMRLEEKIVDAVTPFSVSGGTAAAFVGTNANAETIAYVETFVPKSSGTNYIPHVTAGVAREAFVKQLQAEPFQAFNFKPDGSRSTSLAILAPRRRSSGRARLRGRLRIFKLPLAVPARPVDPIQDATRLKPYRSAVARQRFDTLGAN